MATSISKESPFAPKASRINWKGMAPCEYQLENSSFFPFSPFQTLHPKVTNGPQPSPLEEILKIDIELRAQK